MTQKTYKQHNRPPTDKRLKHRSTRLLKKEKFHQQQDLNDNTEKLFLLEAQLAQKEEERATSAALLEKALADLASSRREIEIEAALEAVRSRSLTMSRTDELADVITIVLEKLQALGVTMQGRTAYIATFDDEIKEMAEWVASTEHARPLRFVTPYIDHPVVETIWNARLHGVDFINRTFTNAEKDSFFTYYFQQVCCDNQLDHIKALVFDSTSYGYSIAFAKNSAIGISSFTGTLLSAKEIEILKRFANVFEQAYIRFLNLQKSDAQVKEAWVEAGLEKIRSRTMTMQNSRDVGDAIGVLFTELEKLEIATLRCGIFIIEEETKTLEVWTAAPGKEERIGKASGRFSFTIHPMLEGAFRAWKKKKANYTYELAGKELTGYFETLSANNPGYTLPAQAINVDRQYGSGFFFAEGALFTFTAEPLPAETLAVLNRFAAVFGLTYRRYLDLKMTEEQTRQALKQASIDRLRAEIASMRTAEDLQRIIPHVWRELKTFHVPFVRCGVLIIHPTTGLIQAYLSNPDGQSLGVVQIPVDEWAHIRKLVAHWQNATVFTDHWSPGQFRSWVEYLGSLKQEKETDNYLHKADVTDDLHLHFIPFTQGMLYVGNTFPLKTEELQPVQDLANAFAMAYARYEDFKKLEVAKNKVEATLNELRSTQQQLIQAEKMASLGELTAGIAHEIRNPLNFVNNFSELSVEMLKEMEEILPGSQSEEVLLLIKQIQQLLQKISYYGNQADTIVKSMLQHSRKNEGQRVPTDLNALVEKSLHLSFQGEQAKDETFDAILQTHYDEGIGLINIIPQDIARLLHNLFNNAFYALREKKNRTTKNYQPTIRVMTRMADEKVEIIVKDNGTGIPEKFIQKVFQPFFTTKPAGVGIGLGLSLGYDIAKMHGGQLHLKSIEGEETEITVVLKQDMAGAAIPIAGV